MGKITIPRNNFVKIQPPGYDRFLTDINKLLYKHQWNGKPDILDISDVCQN